MADQRYINSDLIISNQYHENIISKYHDIIKYHGEMADQRYINSDVIISYQNIMILSNITVRLQSKDISTGM